MKAVPATAFALAFGVLAAAPPATLLGAPPAQGMSAEQFDRLHGLIKPQKGEWKFAEIPWERNVWEARKKAAATGKPIFIWYMVGEPLGQC